MPSFRRYVTIISVVLAVAVALRVFLEVLSWLTLAALIVAWPLVGTLITIDDDLPGGWGNSDGKSVPEWKMLWWWADLLLVRGALVVFAFVTEQALAGKFAVAHLVAAVAMVGLGLPVFLRGVRRESSHAV